MPLMCSCRPMCTGLYQSGCVCLCDVFIFLSVFNRVYFCIKHSFCVCVCTRLYVQLYFMCVFYVCVYVCVFYLCVCVYLMFVCVQCYQAGGMRWLSAMSGKASSGVAAGENDDDEIKILRPAEGAAEIPLAAVRIDLFQHLTFNHDKTVGKLIVLQDIRHQSPLILSGALCCMNTNRPSRQKPHPPLLSLSLSLALSLVPAPSFSLSTFLSFFSLPFLTLLSVYKHILCSVPLISNLSSLILSLLSFS